MIAILSLPVLFFAILQTTAGIFREIAAVGQNDDEAERART